MIDERNITMDYKEHSYCGAEAEFTIMDINIIENFTIKELEKYDFNPCLDFAASIEKYYKNLRNTFMLA